MLSSRLLFFLLVCFTPSVNFAQLSMTEVIDSLLDGRDINGVSVNGNGETLLYDDNHIFTFVNSVTEDFICNLCYDIQDVVSLHDTQYIASKFGGIIKRFGDSLAIVADFEASELAVHKDGILYGNDPGNGLFRWNGSDVDHWDESNSNLPTDWVYDLAVDSNGLVWLATQVGLVSFNGNSFSHKDVPDDLSATFYDIAIDEHNAVWVSSAYGGVGKFANSTWTTFPQTFNVLQLVQNVAILHGDEVWTSSFEKGLYRYINNNFIKYLPSVFGYSTFENCSFLYGDAQGRLWMEFDNTPLMYLTTMPTAVDRIQDHSNELSISPNPSNGIVHLSLSPDQDKMTSIMLYTSEGSLCYKSTSLYDNEVSLDISHLAAGLYQVMVTNDKGDRMGKKIVLQ